MTLDELERVERITLEMVVQALTDYRQPAKAIFREETDSPQDIAEDVTREAVEAMGMPALGHRLYGKVDFKKAIYVFLPAAMPVALMLDVKAEKLRTRTTTVRTATIQMSQTSMRVRQMRGGVLVDEPGLLDQTIPHGDKEFQVVTVVAKYVYYTEQDSSHRLQRIIVAGIPNGRLQQRYNPNADDTIWSAGKNAKDEKFRVRLNYSRLSNKAAWRVRAIPIEEESRAC